MEYVGWALVTTTAIDPTRAIFAAAGAIVAGLVIFFIRNKRNIAERLKRNHG